MRLEENVRKRLTVEVCQTYIDTNSKDTDEVIVMQQMIDSLSRDIWQLRWNVSSKVLNASAIQTPTHDAEEHAGFSPLFQNAAADTLKTKDKWVGGWAEQAVLALNVQNLNNPQQSKGKKPQKIGSCQTLVGLFSSNAAPEDVKNYLKVATMIVPFHSYIILNTNYCKQFTVLKSC
ncbi:unnamed protein product [Adineta steineri]|uniref:Uncharacterized protein n=1 Tax=Adineta steineri TaxID=433720 RepID=A0A818IH79_9BILA|nr:unnamed protein product [Adineta steineri]CAF3524495.1 unnamed protein product [Adineta steineri]